MRLADLTPCERRLSTFARAIYQVNDDGNARESHNVGVNWNEHRLSELMLCGLTESHSTTAMMPAGQSRRLNGKMWSP